MEFLCILKMFFIVVYIVLNIFVMWVYFDNFVLADPQDVKLKRYHIVFPIICPIGFIIFLIIIVILLLIIFLLKILFIIIDWLEKPLINRRNDDSKTIE